MRHHLFLMKAVALIPILLCSFASNAQTESPLLWPIKGQKAGTNILLRPQDPLDHEVNFGNLVIGAKEGTEVIAPADGMVSGPSLIYCPGLFRCTAYGFDDDRSFDALRKKMEADPDVRDPRKYINGCLTLTLDDGRKINFHGLRGNTEFKSGQRVKAGTVLGTVSYVYEKINGPHISLEIEKKGVIDPMTPFGLQTTFKVGEEFTPPEKLTREQANEDFDFFMESLRECVPTYHEIITPKQEEAFVRDCKAKLDADEVSFTTLYDIVGDAFTARFMHDSHAWRQSSNPFPNPSNNVQYPAIMLCTLGDRMFVRQVQPGYEEYIGKEVATVNEFSAKEQAAHHRLKTEYFDAKVESTVAIQVLANWWGQYDDTFTGTGAHLTFTDGTSVDVPFLKRNQVKGYTPQPTGPVAYYVHKNQNRKEDWSFKMLDDKTALLTLAHFQLNEVQMDNIADSLRAHAQVPNLIIDVRDNPGGSADCEGILLNMFLFEKPAMFNRQMVNSNTTYRSFNHCYNWSKDMTPFEDFVKIEGKDGFYNKDAFSETQTSAQPQKNDAIYKGKIYVLTNEGSISAATDFPAHLVRAGRAKTIGRETATAYHYMTALKFARLFLPNTHIEYHLPLVKAITATNVSERFPYGRGLLPDYEVPLTQEEVFFSSEDVILKRALDIIHKNS